MIEIEIETARIEREMGRIFDRYKYPKGETVWL